MHACIFRGWLRALTGAPPPSLPLRQLVEVNPSLAGDTQVTIQPGTRIAIPPFTKDCGDGALGTWGRARPE